MAEKKGDDIENNDDLNDQTNNDFGDADDNFGLPDVDFQPLDESDDDIPEDDNSSSQDADEEVSSTYSEDETSDEEEGEESYSGYEESTEESEYVPGSYTKPEEESSNIGKIVGIVFGVVLAGIAIWYLGFYRPAQQKEKERVEKIAQEWEKQRIAAEKKEEAERIANEEAEKEAQRLAELEKAKPKKGSVETINARTGRYYVVVASAVDGDLAMDYAKKLAKQGQKVEIIPPYGKNKFHRITIDNLDSQAAGENRINELKSEFGQDVWLIKY